MKIALPYRTLSRRKRAGLALARVCIHPCMIPAATLHSHTFFFFFFFFFSANKVQKREITKSILNLDAAAAVLKGGAAPYAHDLAA